MPYVIVIDISVNLPNTRFKSIQSNYVSKNPNATCDKIIGKYATE